LDTGFLLAVLDADDEMHESCSEALLAESAPILPDVVLPELAYMVLKELGYSVLIDFLNSLHKGEMVIEHFDLSDLARAAEILEEYADSQVDLVIEHFDLSDLARAAEILEEYADSQVDFVDCAIVAIAERLNIQRILTVDRRHFRIFRPKHYEYFVIVP